MDTPGRVKGKTHSRNKYSPQAWEWRQTGHPGLALSQACSPTSCQLSAPGRVERKEAHGETVRMEPMPAVAERDVVLVLVVGQADRAALLLLESAPGEDRVGVDRDRARCGDAERLGRVLARRERPRGVLERRERGELVRRDALHGLDVPEALLQPDQALVTRVKVVIVLPVQYFVSLLFHCVHCEKNGGTHKVVARIERRRVAAKERAKVVVEEAREPARAWSKPAQELAQVPKARARAARLVGAREERLHELAFAAEACESLGSGLLNVGRVPTAERRVSLACAEVRQRVSERRAAVRAKAGRVGSRCASAERARGIRRRDCVAAVGRV